MLNAKMDDGQTTFKLATVPPASIGAVAHYARIHKSVVQSILRDGHEPVIGRGFARPAGGLLRIGPTC
jgi:hypothetical protein